MSVSSTLGNFQNKADMQKKRADFFKTLNLQADLNRKYEEAMIQRAQNERLGIQPITGMPRSVEDGRLDDLGQQKIALRHLESIMNASQALKALNDLGVEDIKKLNTFWGKFAAQIKGIQNIDADFFRRLFANFMQYVDETGDLMRPIPLKESTISKLPQELMDAWTAWSRQMIDPMTGEVVNLPTLIRETAEALSRTLQEVKREVAAETATESAETSPFSPGRPPIPSRPSRSVSESFARAREPFMSPTGSRPVPTPQRSPSPSRPASPGSRSRVQEIAEAEGFPSPIYTAETLSRNTAGRLYRAIRDQDALADMKMADIRAILKPTEKIIRTKEEGFRVLEQEFGTPVPMQPFETEMSGTGARRRRGGVATSSAQKKNLGYRSDGSIRYARGLMFGSGLVAQRSNDYVSFGKYILNTDALQHGVLHVKFPSLQAIAGVPPRQVSSEFVKLMNYILDNNMMHDNLFSNMSASEQTYMTYLLQRSQMKKKLRKQEHAPLNEQARRFELLRGIIKAGNDDPSVMGEMRSVLHRLVRV